MLYQKLKIIKILPEVLSTKGIQIQAVKYFINILLFHSSILAWKSPWTEEPGGLQSMELHD